MSQQSKLIILVIYLMILAIIMLSYRSNRAKKVKLLRSQIAQVQSEKTKIRRGEEELKRLTKLFPAESGVTSIIESLYVYAKDSGLKLHEVTAEGNKKQSANRPGSPQKDTASMTTTSIVINLSGNFREISEYFRQVQNMDRFNRVAEFKLSPDGDQIKGILTIEFFSMAVQK